jgi:HAD superfamily hydrolase (TIGR01490 family)
MCCASSPDSPALPETAIARAGDKLTASEPRGGSLAVFDLDGTITRFDTLLPFVLRCLAYWPARLPRLLLVLPALMRFLLTRDHGALKAAFMHRTIAGLHRESLQEQAQRFIKWLLRRGVYQQALQAIEGHRARGDRLLLMSASPDLYVPQLAAALGFDQVICTPVRWRADGTLDGRLAGENCRGHEKQRQLSALIERQRPAHVYAYGNSRSDLWHLRLAQQGYLVNSRASLQGSPGVQRLRWRS